MRTGSIRKITSSQSLSIHAYSGIVSQGLFDLIIGRGIGNNILNLFGVVDIVEVTKLGSEQFLGVELAEDASGFGGNVVDGEMIAQQEVEVYVVLPFGAAPQGISLHGGELKQGGQTEICLKFHGRLDGEGILKEGEFDIVDDEVHLLLDTADDSEGDACGGQFVKVTFVVDGRGLEQVEVDGTAMAKVESDSGTSHEIVLTPKLCQKREQFSLFVVQYLAMHIA